MYKHNQLSSQTLTAQLQSKLVADLYYRFLTSVLAGLNEKLDRRFVQTFLQTVLSTHPPPHLLSDWGCAMFLGKRLAVEHIRTPLRKVLDS